MRLIRGWENQYAPDPIGSLRLSQARRYREIGEGEEVGLGSGEASWGYMVHQTDVAEFGRTHPLNEEGPLSKQIAIQLGQ